MLGTGQRITNAAEFVRGRWASQPKFGIILGTGLGNLAEQIESPVRIPYADVPELPSSTAIGHKGQFVCGRLHGANVIAMQGRFHLYEGYSAELVAFPVRVMERLGIVVLWWGCVVVGSIAVGLYVAIQRPVQRRSA